MKTGDNVRLRADGRYEARYIKERNQNGKLVYGCCYGRTYEEAVEKRDYQLSIRTKTKQLNLLILGAGSHGDDVYEIARGIHVFSKIAFLDDYVENEKVIGKWSDAKNFVDDYPVAIVAVGDEETRREWTKKIASYGFYIPTLVHPTAFVPDGVTLGGGTVICARATLSTGVSIGKGCIISSGAIVQRKTYIPDWGYFDIDRVIHYKRENKDEER